MPFAAGLSTRRFFSSSSQQRNSVAVRYIVMLLFALSARAALALPPEIVQGRDGIRATETLDLKKNEQRLIRQALDKFKGNRKRAAAALNISAVTLWRKMKEYGLSEE